MEFLEKIVKKADAFSVRMARATTSGDVSRVAANRHFGKLSGL
jgi:hypothetical protein